MNNFNGWSEVKMEISVLMSTYNPNEEYFVKSVKSILNQSMADFEFIIIDDGSTIDITKILSNNSLNDPRIKLIRLEQNIGLPRALNYGLNICKGKYVARMDDDDLAEFNRFEVQYNFLNNNTKYSGCWALFDVIDGSGNSIKQNNIWVSEEGILKRIITKGNFLCHPTLFIKREVINEIGGYDENLRYAQDNDLYIRLLEKYKLSLVKQKLLKYRRTSMRKNLHRDCLAEAYIFFSKLYFLKRNNQIKYKFWFLQYILNFIIRSLLRDKTKYNKESD
jgi:glycosyltransferase involved in cell wall biosynthesis